MKKDIEQRKVDGVALAIVPDAASGVQGELWNCYLLNLKSESLFNVLISSRGYGTRNEEPVNTTTLRFFYEEIGPEHAVLIEPIQRTVFDLTNEYWISFRIGDYTYDKKYVFTRGSIAEDFFTSVPLLEQRGVLHR